MLLEIAGLVLAVLLGMLVATWLGKFRFGRFRQLQPKYNFMGTAEISRYAAVYDLIASLETVRDRQPDDFNYDLDPKEMVEERLWALYDYVHRFGFMDLERPLFEDVIKRDVTAESMEYLSYSILPEIIRRLRAREVRESQILNSSLGLLHSDVSNIALERWQAGNYADAVEAALKEVNSRVKTLVKKRIGQELDGASLMRRAFSEKDPVIMLADLKSVSGRNVQLGFMDIFAGAMTGIRNPKAHANIEVDQDEAIYLLGLASLLMLKIDRQFHQAEAAEPVATADT